MEESLIEPKLILEKALVTGLSALSVAFFVTVSHAAGRFAAYNLRVLDRITEMSAADLNGDGLDDLLVIHTKGFPPASERWISTFWQRPDGGFSTAADLAWRLPDSIVALDTGDIRADPGDDLIALTSSGVFRVAYTGSAAALSLEPVIDVAPVALPPSEDDTPLLDFVQDWNGDGRDDVAVIGPGRLLIFNALQGGSFSGPDSVEIETRVNTLVDVSENGRKLDAISVTRRSPSFAPVDLDGDGDTDLASYWDDQVRFHLRVDGLLSFKPGASVWLKLLEEEEKSNRDFDLGVSVMDVDGDGIADIFAGKSTRRGVGDFFSSVVLYFGGGGLDFEREPDWATSVKGTSRGHWIDLDGDGRRELMLPVVSLGITDIVRILLTKNVKVEFYFYFLSKGREISQTPGFIKEVTLEVGLEEGGGAQAVDFSGDYNGDGRNDLVVGTGKNELSVFLGKEPSKGELFDRKPEEKIPVDPFGDLRAMDLNGDGKDDMILYYRDHPTMSSHARILVNLGSW